MPFALRAALLLAWLLWCALRLPPTPHQASPEGLVVLAGRVEALRCDDLDRCRLTLWPAVADGHPIAGRVQLSTDGDPEHAVSPGDVVAVTAFLRAERTDRNPGVSAPWSAPRARWRAWAQPTAHLGVSDGQVPWRLPSAALETLAPRASALYRALLLGDKRGLSLEVRAAFADTGTAHLLAISGLHLAVVGWGLYRILVWLLVMIRPLGQSRRVPALAAGLAIPLTWAYVLGISPSAATQRACVLLSFVLFGGVVARRIGVARALVLTAVVLISWDPAIVLGPSFQLSFAAVGAIVAVREPLRRLRLWLAEPGRLQGPLWRHAARWLVLGGVVSLVTTAATAPLTLAWFGQLAPWGIVVNLVAVPFVSLWVVPVGLAWYVLATTWPAGGELLAWLPEGAAAWLWDVTLASAHWLGPSHVPAWPHLAGILGSVAVVGVLAARGVRWPFGLLGVLAASLALWPSPPGLTMTVLDVGHGDALVVESPDGRVALVDTGGRGGERGSAYLAARTVLPALARLGHRRLDALVLTHADADHVGAALRLAARLEIDQLWLPPCALLDDVVGQVVDRVRAGGGQIRALTAEHRISWGPMTWQVLWPRPGAGCEAGKNESGLVMRLDYAGRRILLTADIGEPTERRLLEDRSALAADVLKVGHHGSRGSSVPEFLAAVDPQWAIVSGRFVGGRMPPHQEVLTRLCRRGVMLSITGRDGAIQLRVSPEGGLEVAPWRHRLRPP